MLVLTVTKPAIQHIHRSRKTDAQSKRSCGHGVSENEPPVRRRRSQQLQIDLKTHCLFCAEECLPTDPKHPERHKRFSQCETVERPGIKTFKDSVLDICECRNDEWGYQVDTRIRGEADLVKAEDIISYATIGSVNILMPVVDVGVSSLAT